MATTPKTVRTYALDGTKKDFTIPFEYLARKFVVVTLIGANRRELVLNTEYRFTTNTTITTTKAWGPADNFDLIEIRRLTSATERLVDFADGSILRAYDLNISQVQSLHIAEEARDLTADTIGVNNDGDLDARARKIVNLADGVNDGDAVNLRQQKQWAGSALNQANSAAASAAAALASQNAAAGSNSNAYANSLEAKRQADISTTYAGESYNHRIASENARTTSVEASNSSKAWASHPEDALVSGALYSSYHYSRKSAASASSSATSASNSANSASAAAGSAATAANEAAKLGNANGLMDLVQSTTGQTFKLKDGHAANIPAIYTDWITSRTAESPVTISDSLSVSGAASFGTTIYASQTINTAGGLYDNGQRAWSPLNFNPNNKVEGTGQVATNGRFSGVMGAQYDYLAAGMQVYNGGIEVRENGLVGAGGPSPNHEYNAPGITFHWGAKDARKLFMTTEGHLNWGNHSSTPARLGVDGNIYGDAWGGWLSTWLTNSFLQKGNLASSLVSNGEQGVGSYAFCRSGVTATYGVDVAGGNLTYGSTYSNGGSVPGTWRSRGWAGVGNHTLFQRIA